MSENNEQVPEAQAPQTPDVQPPTVKTPKGFITLHFRSCGTPIRIAASKIRKMECRADCDGGYTYVFGEFVVYAVRESINAIKEQLIAAEVVGEFMLLTSSEGADITTVVAAKHISAVCSDGETTVLHVGVHPFSIKSIREDVKLTGTPDCILNMLNEYAMS